MVGSDETSYDQKRQAQFARHLDALNAQYADWVKNTLEKVRGSMDHFAGQLGFKGWESPL